jgi:hypothetical protein
VSTPAQIGRYEWRAAVKSGQDANEELRTLLRRMMREGGPVVQALVGQAALVVMDNEVALGRLDEIGRQTKSK